jgi:uncharacterized protein YdiU (UPF0061 family)
LCQTLKAFVEKFKPVWSPFTSDMEGKFGFVRQPRAMQSNVFTLARALVLLMEQEGSDAAVEEMQAIVGAEYNAALKRALDKMRASKLGVVLKTTPNSGGSTTSPPDSTDRLDHDGDASARAAKAHMVDGLWTALVGENPPLGSKNGSEVVPARCAISDRILHSRLPLDPTHVRLTLFHACDQCHSSRESTVLTVAIINHAQTLKGLLERSKMDYTLFFRELSQLAVAGAVDHSSGAGVGTGAGVGVLPTEIKLVAMLERASCEPDAVGMYREEWVEWLQVWHETARYSRVCGDLLRTCALDSTVLE